MKECGGSGKHGEIPHVNYVTEWFELGEQCPMCKISFKDNAGLKEHAKSYHGDYITKWWSKSAIENIHEYKDYNDWLEKEANVENYETHNKNQILEELKKTNEISIEKNQELLEHNDTFVKVAERGNIIETRRSILKQRDDGTFSKSVVVEQFANVTKRKTNVDKENIDVKNTTKRMRHQSQGLNEILDHMSDGNVEMKSKIIANVIDTGGESIASSVAKKSIAMKLTQKLSKEDAAGLISGAGLSDCQAKLFRTACNKTLGANPLASAHGVTQARHELLPISKEDWEITHHDLYKTRFQDINSIAVFLQ